jgi:hypothetical protein
MAGLQRGVTRPQSAAPAIACTPGNPTDSLTEVVAAGNVHSLDDKLHRRAKSYAAEHGTTLTALVEEALSARLAERGQRRPPVRLPTFRGEGLQDGLSLDEMGTIYDRMGGLR